VTEIVCVVNGDGDSNQYIVGYSGSVKLYLVSVTTLIINRSADSMKCVHSDVIFRSSHRCVVTVKDPSLFCVYFDNSAYYSLLTLRPSRLNTVN